MSEDTWLIVGIAFFLFFILTMQKKAPAVTDRPSPLPINLYTNGVANGNTNDVLTRRNFEQQPYG